MSDQADNSAERASLEKEPAQRTDSGAAAITRDAVIEALKLVEDPELFLDIWFLGLVYAINIEDSSVKIQMTFTSPMCPAGPMLIDQVKSKVGAVAGVNAVEVEIVFSPPWEPSDEVKAMLGLI